MENWIIKDEKPNYSFEDHLNMFEKIDENEDFLNKIFKKEKSQNLIIKDHVYNDLDFWGENDDIFKNDKWIKKLLIHHKTIFGNFYFKHLLKNVIYDIDTLKRRQMILKKVNNEISLDIDREINVIKNNEKDILWFWKEKDEHIQEIMSTIYYQNKYLLFLNSNPLYLTIWNFYKTFISPLHTALGPIIAAILPYIFMRFMGIKVPIKQFLTLMIKQSLDAPSMILSKIPGLGNENVSKIINLLSKTVTIFFYFQNIYYNIKFAKHINNLSIKFHKKLNNINKVIISVKNIQKIFIENNLINDFHNFNETINEKLNINLDWDIIQQINNKNINKENIKIYDLKGNIFSTFYNFIYQKENLIQFLKFIGIVDYINGLIKLLKNNYSLVTYEKNEMPLINIKNMWHPSIDKNVYNSIKIDNKSKDIIITGPNAAGKSTFIKSLIINVLFAQTLCIAPCEKIILTPFHYINTYLHIGDIAGMESLFQAEIRRCKEYIDMLEEMKVDNKFCLTIFDEIFSSTNYIEGYAGAKSFCKHIHKYSNSVSIITTHYTKLSTLKKDGFVNYKFEANEEGDELKFNYKIRKGVSNQYIALKLMQLKGFDNYLVKDAIDIAKKMTRKKNKNKS